MIKTIKITSIITMVLLLAGLIFKTMHWPGAIVLLACGTATGILLFITLLSGILSKLSGGMEKLSVIVASLTLIASLLVFLFKALHWPGANILIWTADTGILLSTITILIDGLLEKELRKLGLKMIAAFFAFILLLIILLLKKVDWIIQ
jgi:hypothetical protein